ncbi:MAG TPA: penicillin-binding protein [Candidatus Onthocola stercoravium]|nr:penicillin-binding protein [Candidatus Onthocola stercoravium]
MKKRATVKISKIIILIVAFLFVAAIIKLSYIVLSSKVDGIDLQAKAASITTTEETLYANRGNIYDVNGEMLATTVNAYTVIAYLDESRTTDAENPRHVVDKEATAAALAPLLEMSEERLMELLNKDVYQVELGPGGRGITEVLKRAIEELELPGIDFISDSKKRYYSNSTFASYIIGYAKENEEGKLVGELGVEGYYDDILSGTNGYTKYLKYTSSNYKIPNTIDDTKKAVDGSDIYLTIDFDIQYIAENAVKEFQDTYKTEWAIFTVMDADTGAIVASATSPNFNPNDTNTITSYMNPLVSYQYEPGSVMKIFSFASAIEEGLYDGNELYESGSIQVDSETIINDVDKTWGTISFDTGFAYSSNVAATMLAFRLLENGEKKLPDYYDALGFGKKTGIELANEVSGDMEVVYKSELANSSFGQGISVTPIQMLQALSSMTNDGNIIKPYIVDKIVDSEGNVTYEGKRTVVNNVYSSQTVDKMHELMHKMIYEGLSTAWQIEGLSMIGKTGTAQIASPNGGYLTGEYDTIRSFAGIFPEEDPEYIVYVAARKVEGNSVKFANVVTDAIEEIAKHAKLTSETKETDLSKVINIENYLSKDINSVTTMLENRKLNIIVIGNGKYVINQYPLKNSIVLENGKLFLITNGIEIKIPNMTGWSLSDVKNYCNLIGLNLEYSGYGYVVSQSIAQDTVLDIANMTLNVHLE